MSEEPRAALARERKEHNVTREQLGRAASRAAKAEGEAERLQTSLTSMRNKLMALEKQLADERIRREDAEEALSNMASVGQGKRAAPPAPRVVQSTQTIGLPLW